ncbi:MAG: hypothetical protein ABIE81_04240 [Candidatus Omnitrophota bacterium]
MVITNVTAMLMAKAGLVSLEMAIKGHNPRNLDNITLLMNTAEMNIVKNCPAFIQFCLSLKLSASFTAGKLLITCLPAGSD